MKHGDLVTIQGRLPSNAKTALERAGAFQTDEGWACLPESWERVRRVLEALGVPFRAEGEPAVVPPPPQTAKAAAMSMMGGRIRIQGDLPKPVQKHWLGQMRDSGHVGMSPWAIEDFLKDCQEQRITVEMDDAIQDLRERLQRRRQAVDAALKQEDLPDVDLPAPYKLRVYQRQALAFGEACGGRFFIGDDVGGGKTAEAIGWKRYSSARRIVVICPSVARGGWREEIQNKFDGKDATVQILEGYADRSVRLPEKGWVITGTKTLSNLSVKGRNYPGWLPRLKEWKPDLVIIDESHKAKGHDSDISASMREIARSVRDFIPMTGTDQDKSPMDLWSTLDAIEPGWWGTWFEFGLAFCKGQQKKRWYGKGKYHLYWDMDGVSNAKVLNERLRYVRLRRTTDELGLELPPQTRIKVPVDLTPEARAEYNEVLEEYKAFCLDEAAKEQGDNDDEVEQTEQKVLTSRGRRMKFILKMDQIGSLGRVDGTLDLVEDIIEQNKRPLVFAFYTEVLHAIRDGLKARKFRVGFIDGSTPSAKRDEVRHDYLAGKYDVVVGQTEAMGVAMNVQEMCSVTVTHELTYKLLDLKQTEGRAYRSEQRKPVFHYYPMGNGTRDHLKLDILLRKMAAKRAVDEGGSDGIEEEFRKEIEKEFFLR